MPGYPNSLSGREKRLLVRTFVNRQIKKKMILDHLARSEMFKISSETIRRELKNDFLADVSQEEKSRANVGIVPELSSVYINWDAGVQLGKEANRNLAIEVHATLTVGYVAFVVGWFFSECISMFV